MLRQEYGFLGILSKKIDRPSPKNEVFVHALCMRKALTWAKTQKFIQNVEVTKVELMPRGPAVHLCFHTVNGRVFTTLELNTIQKLVFSLKLIVPAIHAKKLGITSKNLTEVCWAVFPSKP